MAYQTNYSARNFADIRLELLNYVKQYYPDIFSDFNDASVGTMLLELNAATADILSYHTDRMFQETQIDYAYERNSLLSLARTMGVNVPNTRPSISVVNWSVVIPVNGDTFDVDYCPIIKRGSQATGAGKIFEVLTDIDFSSQYNSMGISNRTIVPNRNSNGIIANYTIVKQEIVYNGFTKVFSRVLNQSDSVPFLEIILPEDNVLSVENLIILPGTNYTTIPTLSQFIDPNNAWYEVDSLAENKIFVEDTNSSNLITNIKKGVWENVTKKFIKEYTNQGFCKLTFGSGYNDISFTSEFDKNCKFLVDKIGDFINNTALGEIPPSNSTMFIRYRVGGGADTNLGPNTLTNLGIVDMVVNGSDVIKNNAVRQSLEVNNPIPATGGADQPSTEELRGLIKYNFSSQNRCVTIKDYKSRITLMPGSFGSPFRNNVWEEQNKIVVGVMTLDENNKLSNTTNTVLNQNISEYLSDFRMLNDYIVVRAGRVYNLGFDVDLFVDKSVTRSEIIANVITVITNYFDISKQEMAQNIYLAQLIEQINNVAGVLNVIDIKVYNKVGGGLYSLNEVSQPYINSSTKQIDLMGLFTLFADPDSMFEIKYPEKDIRVSVR